MATISYLDFDLLIERSEGAYRARVVSSPAGQATGDFGLPFSDMEVENFVLRIGRTRRGVRRIESPEMDAAKSFGGRLFNGIFAGEVRSCFRSSLDEASQQGAGLRVRLRLADVPELVDLPWEYLYYPTLNRFLVLSAETPVVRYLDLPERIQPLKVEPPLKVLVMIASPSDYPPLDTEQEWTRLKDALKDLEERGLVLLERLDRATLSSLQRQLRKGEYHVFHFIGHGGFDQQAQDGILLLEDETGRGRPVSGQDLGIMLHDERSLRLAILNACEGARASRSDPFAGTAQSLVQQGIPAVIGMQFEITDRAAITLSHEFYEAIADGFPVDAALAEARRAIFAQGNDVEWGTPVLYLRAPDGRIFDVAQGQRPIQPVPVAVPVEVVQNELASAPRALPMVEPARAQPVPTPIAAPAVGSIGVQRLPKIAGLNLLWIIGAAGVLTLVGIIVLLSSLAGGENPAPTLTATFTKPTRVGDVTLAAPVGQVPSSTPTPSLTPAPSLPITRTRQVDGMVIVFVPAGPFLIGSRNDPNASGAEFPQHSVTLNDYWIDQTEVTNAHYSKCVQAASGCQVSEYATKARFNGDDQPVVGVDWDAAVTYCHWAGAALPTEQQWEKAARGTDGRIYPWGNQAATCEYAVIDEGNGSGCGRGDAAWPVGSKPKGASPYGALDMAGNVWEWVDSWYDGYPGATEQNPLFGKRYRIQRGGGWGSFPSIVRAANRRDFIPSHRDINIGFRCVVVPE